MAAIIFGRTQSALDTPFIPNRNPGYGGTATDIESTDVQNAIEEAKLDALSNDRYIILCSYNGNANTGRYMQSFPGIDMSEAPIYLPVQSKLLTVVAGSTANSTSTIGFYDLLISSTVPVYSVSFTNNQLVTVLGSPAAPLATFNMGAELAVKVESGSVNKPHIYFFLSAAT